MATTETKSNSQTTGPPLLADRVAIVTGASGGIGAASARAFASTGAAVLPAARDAEDLDSVVHEIAAQGGQALGVPADVTGADAVRRVVETFGRLDAALNNTGGNLRQARLAGCPWGSSTLRARREPPAARSSR